MAGDRDVRLDLFRGLAMMIILIAHIPINEWALWIPARFGFSDATEIFVFCSGFASARAFGRLFETAGFRLGTLRILFRCWQIFWAHIALFVVVAALCVAAERVSPVRDYIAELNLGRFFADPESGLLGLLTLRYVPNYFDILPMYMVILAMTPVVVGLHRLSPWAAAGGVLALWLASQIWDLNLPAEPWSERPWFFNPFGWQLIFFTGFGFGAGWIAPPRLSGRVALGLALVLLAAVPFSWYRLLDGVPALAAVHAGIQPLIDKTGFGILRWLHFLALAYIAVWTVTRIRDRLSHPIARQIIGIGQQSLAAFLTSMTVAWLLGVLLDHSGRSVATVAIANLLGFAVLVAIAHLVGYVKSTPWVTRAAPVSVMAPAAEAPRSPRRTPVRQGGAART
jgi:hypothetical protein